MSQQVRNQEPKSLWNHFADLNAVPRPSKKEERVRAFMRDFGKSLDLEVVEDQIGNVIIKKPATLGMEDRKSIILQSHLDMVHQKNNDNIAIKLLIINIHIFCSLYQPDICIEVGCIIII